VEQQQHALELAVVRGRVKRRDSIGVAHVGIGAIAQQQRDARGVPVMRSVVQSSVAPLLCASVSSEGEKADRREKRGGEGGEETANRSRAHVGDPLLRMGRPLRWQLAMCELFAGQ